MCELFGMSCSEPDRATKSLPVFADRGDWCKDGWGVGYYQGSEAVVVKSSDSIKTGQGTHPQFIEQVQRARGHVVLAHVRYKTSGKRDECNSHPFKIRYLDRYWMFAHNGSIPDIVTQDYHSAVEPASDTDSARAFTYILDRVDKYISRSPLKGTYPALKHGVKELREQFHGSMNFLLSDGDILYAFNDSHHERNMYYLSRAKSYAHAFLVTTIPGGLSEEDWKPMPRDRLIVLYHGYPLILSDTI